MPNVRKQLAPPETSKTTSGDIEIDRCVSGAERVRCISKDVTTIPGNDEGVGCVSVSSFVPGRVSAKGSVGLQSRQHRFSL